MASERKATTIALLAGVPVLALFPLPFWLGMGVMHWSARWQQALMALVATAIALVAVFVVVRVHNAIAPAPMRYGPARRAPTREEIAARHAADLARIEANPALAHWLPLARRMQRFDEPTVARYEARYRQLLARSNGRVHAERLLAGDWVGDAEIDYLEHPSRVVTCEHLQPIERDLRRAGIRCIPADRMDLWSAAYLAIDELRARYAAPAFVREVHTDDHPHSPGNVYIRCDACGSSIESGGSERLPP